LFATVGYLKETPMLLLLLLAKIALIALALFFAWKYFEVLRNWGKAVAEVLEHDYTSERQSDDIAKEISEGGAVVDMQVVFTDANGQQIHTSHRRGLPRGLEPMQSYTLWYQRSDPRITSDHGPASWLVAVGGTIIAFVVLMMVR
jgi:hypothetical protein